jgi:hypothetical protein
MIHLTRRRVAVRRSPALPTAPQFFVSVHVPKTAGTTLGLVLDRVTRRRVLMDYPAAQDAARPDPAIAGAVPFLRSYFRGIHGHFTPRRHLSLFPDARFIATLRHPVDRIISHYLHELNDDGAQSLFHAALRDGMDVVEFAGLDGVGNALATYLDGIALADWDLLLLTERLRDSLHLLNFVIGNMDIPQHFGEPMVLPRENPAGARKLTRHVTAAERQAIFARCAADAEIYAEAEAMFRRNIRRYQI